MFRRGRLRMACAGWRTKLTPSGTRDRTKIRMDKAHDLHKANARIPENAAIMTIVLSAKTMVLA